MKNNHRKQYVIDKKFQIKQAFSVVIVEAIIGAIIIIIISIGAGLNNKRLAVINVKNEKMTQSQNNMVTIQQNIIDTILTWAQDAKGQSHKQAIMDIAKINHKNISTMQGNNETLGSNIKSIKATIRINYFLIASLIAFIIIQTIVLYFIMIRKSHKISGPIYVMSNYMKEIIDGTNPTPRPLRKNDELIEFYNLFEDMVKAIKKREG